LGLEYTENPWLESSKEHIKWSGNGYKYLKNVIKKFLVFFGKMGAASNHFGPQARNPLGQ
jgi:hypothetical protein